MAITKLTVNIPVACRLKYADEVEGQYGMQIKLKSDDEQTIYVPVDCAEDLLRLGAKREETKKGGTYRNLPRGKVTIIKAQAAGEKSPHTHITGEGEPLPGTGAVPGGDEEPLPAEGAPRAPSLAPSPDAAIVAEWDKVIRHVYAAMNKMNAEHQTGIQFTGAEVTTSVNGLMISIGRGR